LVDDTLHTAENKTPGLSPLNSLIRLSQKKKKVLSVRSYKTSGTTNLTDCKLQQRDMAGNIQYLHWFLCFVYEGTKALDNFFSFFFYDARLPFNDHFK
jgi:hypothetical protein